MTTEAILRLQKSKLFNQLTFKEGEDHQLSSKILLIVKEVAPLLERIPENMPEFTLHDSSHSAKIVEIMGKIIPDEVLKSLNIVELSLLILSAYLHDIGMTCEKKERESIILDNSDYAILFKSNTDKLYKYENYLSEENYRAATFIQDQIFTEYLRRYHVERSAQYISKNLSSGELSIVYNQIPFYKILIKICDAHGLPVKDLYNTQKFPKQTLVGEDIVNVQFISLVLRLADIMDLDSERTPKVIYEFVNPEDPISIIEWKKHRSIIGTSIGFNQVLYEAECSSPEVERALRQFMDWIEIERKETIELLKTYSSEEKTRYYLLLNDPITKDRIHSDGSYIYGDLSFSLDFHRIMSLLMGQKLYKDSTIALRELIQNSLDAIKVRMRIYENKDENFIPKIIITISGSSLKIEDNGVGMDIAIFQEFFLQIGQSYYSSPKFYSKYSDIDVTSEFGIGILSVFMIASSITLESRKEPDDPNSPFEPIYYDIPTAHSFLVQRPGKRKEIGTSIILNLMDNNPFKKNSALNIVEEIIPNPPFPIVINQDGQEIIYSGKKIKTISQIVYQYDNMRNFLLNINYRDTGWHSPFTHSLLNINFNLEDDAISDIEGEIIIVNSNPVNYYSRLNGHICQRNFTVGYPETSADGFEIKMTDSISNLFPKWISGFLTLNLKGKSCLSISPERTDFIIDEKYKIMKTKIEQKIISSLILHFDHFIAINGFEAFSKYTDFLYAVGFFGIDLGSKNEMSEKSKNFLREYITFSVLNESGEVKRVKACELFIKENIGVIEHDFERESIASLIEFKKNNDIEIVILEHHYFYTYRMDSLFEILLGSSGYFLQPIKLMLQPLFKSPIKLVKYGAKTTQNVIFKEHGFMDMISNSHTIEKDIPVIFTLGSNSNYPDYNASHPIISFLFTTNDPNGELNKLINILTRRIVEVIEESLTLLRLSDETYLRNLSYSNKTYEKMKGILKRDPNLFDSLNKIINEIYNIAQSKNLIDVSAPIPYLKIEDLPWYWN